MTTYLGKSCSFGLLRVPFVNCRQFMYLVISLLVLRAGCGIWLYQFVIIAYHFTFTYLDPILIYISLWIDCLFEIRKLQFHLAFVAGSLQGHWYGFISRNYVVWLIFFLMNVFIALTGTIFFICICHRSVANGNIAPFDKQLLNRQNWFLIYRKTHAKSIVLIVTWCGT